MGVGLRRNTHYTARLDLDRFTAFDLLNIANPLEPNGDAGTQGSWAFVGVSALVGAGQAKLLQGVGREAAEALAEQALSNQFVVCYTIMWCGQFSPWLK